MSIVAITRSLVLSRMKRMLLLDIIVESCPQQMQLPWVD
jgi:hypothetical protein